MVVRCENCGEKRRTNFPFGRNSKPRKTLRHHPRCVQRRKGGA